MNNSDSKNSRLAKIAFLYYEKGMNQQEIAKATGVTRTLISRLLSEAKERNIVSFHIKYPWRSVILEEKLKYVTGLKEVLVVADSDAPSDGGEYEMGLLAAAYFDSHVQNGDVIGISWGTTLHHMVTHLDPRHLSKSKVVQLIGASGTETRPLDGPMLARILSEKIGAEFYPLHAPLIVENAIVRDSLMHDRTIKSTLTVAGRANIAWVGIGSPTQRGYSMLREGYLSEQDISYLVEKGAVGDVCAQLFDIQGNYMEELDLNRRTIGIDLTNLRNVETVVGVAGGKAKREAVLGAVRGKHITVLITDSVVAEYILKHYQM